MVDLEPAGLVDVVKADRSASPILENKDMRPTLPSDNAVPVARIIFDGAAER